MKPFGILLVSTGGLASCMCITAKSMFGDLPHLGFINLEPTDDWRQATEKIEGAFRALDKGNGVMILADLSGGTPFNVAEEVARNHLAVVIGGVNVPMVLKAIQISQTVELKEATTFLTQYGKDHIISG